MRLLLVEDTEHLRHLFARVLARNGFDVLEASDGLEALDRLAAFEPDVIVTDLMMPHMDGFELIRQIRAIPSLAGVPIVAMTAAATPRVEREAKEAGAGEILAKPLDARTLLDRVGKACWPD